VATPIKQNAPRIRLLVLIPAIITFFVALGLIIFFTNSFFNNQQRQTSHDITTRVKNSFEKQIKHSISDISGLLQLISNNSSLQSAWLAKDRKRLSAASQPLYDRVRSTFGITHLYFHTLDGKNFLRAHRPGRFGDNINRKTLLTSRRTGQVSAGLELGTFGQLVLRIVQPWIIDGQLVGYLELGMGIEHITQGLKDITGAEIITLIDKQFINKNDWLKAFGDKYDWQQMDKWVIASSTLNITPANLALVSQQDGNPYTSNHSTNIDGLESSSFRLSDFSNTDIGYMVVIQDTTTSKQQLHELLFNIAIIGLFSGILLSIAYFIYLGRIENRLTQANRSLHQKIGEQKKAENKLTQKTEELASINRELESYSYSIAHDLRAPLRSVTSFSQIVLEDAKDRLTADDIDNLHRVINASKRMAELIDDILQLSRITREELSIKPVNLSNIAEHIKHQLTTGNPERKVEWDIQPDMFAFADQRLIERAIDNLLNNAWKYTAHSNNVKISFGATTNGKETVYFVRDNGAGFDMHYAHKLFATFQRLHNPREFAGSGVGLAIVLRVIQRHHGRTWGEGEVGKGATFYFTLPDTRAT
jgi:signal transduction histidine kinase